MITLITGTPGAGKTLYCISKLLRDLVGSVIKSVDANGQPVETPRRVMTNIPGLLLDHELIGPDVGGGLADWHLWAKPGDVIAYDEVQRSWPPRPNGSKVPDYISALETHRHMGVDFIILTQNPMLLDRNVLALVGRHLHVRRFGGVGAALVYEWDHCSKQLMYSKALKKSPFRYDKSVFKLYKSAELHTKPKTSIPPLVYAVILALCGAAYFIPNIVNRISSKGDQVAPAASKPAASSLPGLPGVPSPSPGSSPGQAVQGGQAYDPTAFVPRVSYEPLSAPAYDQIRQVVVMPVIAGGACFKGSCKCFTHQGSDAGLSHQQCEKWIKSPPFDPYRVQVASAFSETGAARTQSLPAETSSARPASSVSVPFPSGGAINPAAEAKGRSVLPPGSPVHTTSPTDGPGMPPALSFQNPYRRG